MAEQKQQDEVTALRDRVKMLAELCQNVRDYIDGDFDVFADDAALLLSLDAAIVFAGFEDGITTDTRRMDWLQTDTNGSPNVRRIQFRPDLNKPYWLKQGMSGLGFATLREAVDAAMTKQAKFPTPAKGGN